ncbi:MAG: DUF4399 domain-containing protein [Paracoccaceae bacterium]
MNKFAISVAVFTSVAFAMPVSARETEAADGAHVYFVALEDGATVNSPVTIQFGLQGMGVAPAGAEYDFTGHHHLLIDTAAFGLDNLGRFDEGIPSDEHHKHFGGGQTQVTVELPKGTHTLQLLLGDLYHVPHNTPLYSDQITVTVD